MVHSIYKLKREKRTSGIMVIKEMNVIYATICTLFLICFGTVAVDAQKLERYQFRSNHMGSQFTIILFSDSEERAEIVSTGAFNLVEEINQVMSDYLPESELNRLSATSGTNSSVKVSESLYGILKTSKEISKRTDGLFDVTIGPLTRAWRMTRMMPRPELPAETELNDLLSRVGYEYIHLDEENRKVLLEKEGMRIDLGGIAKGYAAERVVEYMSGKGIQISLLDAGGDITLGDPPPGRNFWEVAIPVKKGSNGSHIRLGLQNQTVTTSGDMFQYVVIDGVRYSHIIVPQTGVGSTRQQQASVISDNGMYADAYASALTLMDPEDGIQLIESIPNTEAVIFENRNDEIIRYVSSGFNQYLLD